MKKLLTLILIIVTCSFLFMGCTNIVEESQNTTSREIASKPANQIVDYSSLDYKKGEVMVKVSDSSILEQIADKNGIEILKKWDNINWYLMEVPGNETTEDFIKKLNKNKDIIMAEPNMKYELDETIIPPDVDNYEMQWGFKNIKAESAWEITTGSVDTIVAIVDTGVQVDHPEFSSEKFDGPNAYNIPKEKFGLNCMYDDNGHGTHVAGIAADDGNTGKIAGVAWDSKILPIKVMDDSGYIYTAYLTEAMNYLGDYANNNSDKSVVANMSIGGRGYSYAFKDAIDHAAENGVLLVTSAGNDSKRVLSYPSSYNGVVSVAASTPTNGKADFSTIGHWNSVAAPGVKILSTYVDGSYSYLQGTSMASPYVCGAAALLLSQHPDLTPIEVKNQLEQTANGNGFTEELGYGVIDMEAMLGDLEPMQYGTLDVETNIESTEDTGYIGNGVITVFDSDGVLVSHGTTEGDGNHTFWALKPGDYTVSLSYYDLFKDEYKLKTDDIAVSVEGRGSLEINAEVPTNVIRNDLDEILIEGETQYVYSINVSDKAIYEFETMPHPDYGIEDTIMYLLDENQNIIAQNDDFNYVFSYIVKSLEPGNYYLVVQEFNGDEFNCTLDINQLDVTY